MSAHYLRKKKKAIRCSHGAAKMYTPSRLGLKEFRSGKPAADRNPLGRLLTRFMEAVRGRRQRKR